MIREANMDRKIREVNGKLTLDGSIDLRDFIRLFQRRNKGELLPSMGNVLNIMATKQIDVQEVGVQNAKKFFDAKAAITTQMGDITLNEVKTITQEKQVKREEKAQKQAEFDAKRSLYAKKK